MTDFVQLSYPRSGATLLRHVARYLLKLPALDDKYGIRNDPSGQYIKTHFLEIVFNDKLIVLVRNYNDALVSHYRRSSFPGVSLISGEDNTQHEKYYHPLDTYENWKHGKLLIYYEDLISDPYEVVRRLGEFIEADEERIEIAVERYDELKNQAQKLYKTFLGDTMTLDKGDDFHRDFLTEAGFVELKKIMMEIHPNLYKKYLAHYD